MSDTEAYVAGLRRIVALCDLSGYTVQRHRVRQALDALLEGCHFLPPQLNALYHESGNELAPAFRVEQVLEPVEYLLGYFDQGTIAA